MSNLTTGNEDVEVAVGKVYPYGTVSVACVIK